MSTYVCFMNQQESILSLTIYINLVVCISQLLTEQIFAGWYPDISNVLALNEFGL